MPKTSPEAIAKGKTRAAARTYEHRRRISEIKEERQCADCPAEVWWPYYVLHFDHLPGYEKTREVSRMTSKNWDKILEEIAKCEVVCASHHAIRTQSRSRVRS